MSGADLGDLCDADFELREDEDEADLHGGVAEADGDAVVDGVEDDVCVFLGLDEEVRDFFGGFHE